MSKRPHRENSVEMDNSTPEDLRLTEGRLASMVKFALSAKTPRLFASSMRVVIALYHIHASARTRPLHSKMMALLDEIEKEAPRDRVWHPPMSLRPSKAADRANHARYMVKHARVLALFEEVKFLQRSEPILAAQDAFKQAQSIRASKPRRLNEVQCNRIAKIYWERKVNGTAYGVVKELAREYDVSTATITATAKKYKPSN